MHNATTRTALTISDGGTDTEVLNVKHINRAIIFGPAALDGTLTVQASPDGESGWLDLSLIGNNGAAFVSVSIEIPVDEAIPVDLRGVSYMRIHSSSAESPARTIPVTLGEET